MTKLYSLVLIHIRILGMHGLIAVIYLYCYNI